MLHRNVQRWVYQRGWPGLRPVQETAIPLVLSQEKDCLICAPTAGGKTEAAFLPVFSVIANDPSANGFQALCISPLKALISDQSKRLETLGKSTNVSVTPWHGDINSSRKLNAWKKSEGLLIITPESLEAILLSRSHEAIERFTHLKFIVIDEYHAFLDSPRGRQLLSQLSRLEALLDRKVPRIALSATIGDLELAGKMLRPGYSNYAIVQGEEGTPKPLKLQLEVFEDEADGITPLQKMGAQIFETLRGGFHLVFANSRANVEYLTSYLKALSENAGLREEFFAHHGSLSKEIRTELESRLKKGEQPTTGIATATLELGIDIGYVESVLQVMAPGNVSGLRQRLGRSGRRGSPSILRTFVPSKSQIPMATIFDELELELLQSIAVIELMLEKWVEPPNPNILDYSTLAQQILSMVAYQGGVTAVQLYESLCVNGPFNNISPEVFSEFLRDLGRNETLSQLPSGELIVGVKGEFVVSHYSFFAAFKTPEEYRIEVKGGKSIGTLPIDSPYQPGQMLIFAGKRWKIKSIDDERKTMVVTHSNVGTPPVFNGEAACVHETIRKTMLQILESNVEPAYLSVLAKQRLRDARQVYQERLIGNNDLIAIGDESIWFLWQGDSVINTIGLILIACKYTIFKQGNCLFFSQRVSLTEILGTMREWLSDKDEQDICKLLPAVIYSKFDGLFSAEWRVRSFASRQLDIPAALNYVAEVSKICRD